MRIALAVAVAALAGIVLQTAVFPAVPGLPVVPDLLLVLVVYVAMRRAEVAGVLGAFALGYVLDTFSGTMLGVNAFGFVAAYGWVHLVARRLWTEGGLPLMVVAFVASAIRQLAVILLVAAVGLDEPYWQQSLRYGAVEAGLAALAAPLVFAFVAWEERLLEG